LPDNGKSRFLIKPNPPLSGFFIAKKGSKSMKKSRRAILAKSTNIKTLTHQGGVVMAEA
jgi:hypothetical protein